MHYIRRIAVALIVAALCLIGVAPAYAATAQPPPVDNNVSATVTVLASETLTLSETTLAFGTITPPVTNISPSAQLTATVISSDPLGYTLTWTPPAAPVNFSDGAGHTFPVSGNLVFNGADASKPVMFLSNAGVTPPAGDSTTTDTTLSVPAGQYPAAYTAGPFAIILAGN